MENLDLCRSLFMQFLYYRFFPANWFVWPCLSRVRFRREDATFVLSLCCQSAPKHYKIEERFGRLSIEGGQFFETLIEVSCYDQVVRPLVCLKSNHQAIAVGISIFILAQKMHFFLFIYAGRFVSFEVRKENRSFLDLWRFFLKRILKKSHVFRSNILIYTGRSSTCKKHRHIPVALNLVAFATKGTLSTVYFFN